MEAREFLEWRSKQCSFFLFFDGVSKKNQGVAGARVILHDIKGKIVATFTLGLDQASNN
jgi:ribonuclease HI